MVAIEQASFSHGINSEEHRGVNEALNHNNDFGA